MNSHTYLGRQLIGYVLDDPDEQSYSYRSHYHAPAHKNPGHDLDDPGLAQNYPNDLDQQAHHMSAILTKNAD